MFYVKNYENLDTAQRLIYHYDLFNDNVPVNNSMSTRKFFSIKAPSVTLHEYVSMFYRCRQNKLAFKALLCNAQYFYIVDGDKNKANNALLCFQCNNG